MLCNKGADLIAAAMDNNQKKRTSNDGNNFLGLSHKMNLIGHYMFPLDIICSIGYYMSHWTLYVLLGIICSIGHYVPLDIICSIGHYMSCCIALSGFLAGLELGKKRCRYGNNNHSIPSQWKSRYGILFHTVPFRVLIL